MVPEIRITEDGSPTLFVPELNEHYHSTHGACQESMHVFINAGLLPLINTNRSINILEVGMGTGLNVLLTAKIAEEKDITINYTAIEPFPVSENLLNQLKLHELPLLNMDESRIHAIASATNSEIALELYPGFNLKVLKQPIETVELIGLFHLVYFDAFGPQVQPEIWSDNNFKKIFDLMPKDGILVTYCAKGAVRRSMQSAGFIVERLPGPPGKREMLRAKKLL